jgi:hypothetical protein
LDAAMGKALQAARKAGIQTMDHLVSQALLNPALMRVLLSKATPQNQVTLTTALCNQLRWVSLVSAAQTGSGQDQRQVVPAVGTKLNSLGGLASLGAPPPAPARNALLR